MGVPCPRAARQSTCSELSRAPFLSAPCPWPEMNKTQGGGGSYSWNERMCEPPNGPLSLGDPHQVALINFKLSLVLKLG